MKNKVKIAVCMATYNGEKYIKEQLVSILSELREIDEIIISDDHSTDNTLKIIRELNDSRINIITNHGKSGPSYNFQNALRNARADIYMLADQDDVWVEGRVAKTINALKQSDFCVCDSKVIDKSLNIIDNSRFEFYHIKKGFWPNLLRTRYLGCCMAFTSNVYDKLFPFPNKVNICPHDFWIALVGEGLFRSSLINEPLVLYRRHGNNVSSGGEYSDRSTVLKIFSRIYCLIKVGNRKLSK